MANAVAVIRRGRSGIEGLPDSAMGWRAVQPRNATHDPDEARPQSSIHPARAARH